MDRSQRFETIRHRVNEASAEQHGVSIEDAAFLLSLIDEKEDRVRLLEKKNEVLSRQLLELTQEMENMRGDFGRDR